MITMYMVTPVPDAVPVRQEKLAKAREVSYPELSRPLTDDQTPLDTRIPISPWSISGAPTHWGSRFFLAGSVSYLLQLGPRPNKSLARTPLTFH